MARTNRLERGRSLISFDEKFADMGLVAGMDGGGRGALAGGGGGGVDECRAGRVGGMTLERPEEAARHGEDEPAGAGAVPDLL